MKTQILWTIILKLILINKIVQVINYININIEDILSVNGDDEPTAENDIKNGKGFF